MNASQTMQERIDAVYARIDAACARAGRDPSEVTLVAVSKRQPPELVSEAVRAGITVLGESRIQEAAEKIPQCSGRAEWHLVGHLQTNKVKHAVRLFEMIHSVDSQRVLEAIERHAAEAGCRPDVCLEVNVSGEGSKFGVAPDAVADILAWSETLTAVNLVGLMTVPPLTADPADARPYFRRLRELRDAHGGRVEGLSMGMTRDFEIAIEEGATWVRVGTAIFGERKTG